MNKMSMIAKDFVPPVLFRFLKSFARNKIEFMGDHKDWADALSHCDGYNDKLIFDKVLESSIKVKNGEAVFERDSVIFDQIEYSWPVLAAVLLGASRHGGTLNLLDFGGSLGSSYFQNIKFLYKLKKVNWGVVEQAHFVEAGRRHIQDDRLKFYESIEACMLAQKPNVVLLSGVLQCVPSPDDILTRIFSTNCEIIVLDRTCYINQGRKERIAIQHVPASIYKASYPCRFFVESEMLSKFAGAGYELIESFDALDKLDASATWKGHIFMKKPGAADPGSQLESFKP